MELWVRSQDKKCLIKINLIEYETGAMLKGATDIDDNYHILGKYKTKERALEVLDEIQKILKPMIYTEKGKIVGMIDNEFIKEKDKAEVIELSTYVYEMPNE